jgi:hypothetical protein
MMDACGAGTRLAARNIILAAAVASPLIVRQALQSSGATIMPSDEGPTLAPAVAAPLNIRPSAPTYMASSGATGKLPTTLPGSCQSQAPADARLLLFRLARRTTASD